MIQKHINSIDSKELETKTLKFVNDAKMEFVRHQPVVGNVRQEAYYLEELAITLGEKRELEISNILANYVTLQNFIEDPEIHVLEENVARDEYLEIRRYTTTNLSITVIFEVERISWDLYPQIKFAECNMRIINKSYKQVRIDKALKGLLGINKESYSIGEGEDEVGEEDNQMSEVMKRVEDVFQTDKIYSIITFLKLNANKEGVI